MEFVTRNKSCLHLSCVQRLYSDHQVEVIAEGECPPMGRGDVRGGKVRGVVWGEVVQGRNVRFPNRCVRHFDS